MKKHSFLKVLVIAALSLALLLSFASCGKLKVESFTVVRNSVKTTYVEGEAIDLSGIKVVIEYSDEDLNTTLTVADGLKLEYDASVTATAGTKRIKVTYECPHTGTVQEATLSILVEEDPDAVKHSAYVVDASEMKTTYFVGETIDFTGVKVIEKFTNGGADVTLTDLSKINYTYDASTLTATAGTKSIIVSYNGEAAGAIAITVKNPAITSVTLNTDAVDTEYLKGETASTTGLTATVAYENGETRTVNAFTLVSDLSALLASVGEKDVLLTFVDPISGTEQSTSYKIKVDGIVGYTVDASGAKTEYDAGEDITTAGVTVTANYHFGKTETVTSGIRFDYADHITSSAGNKQISVYVDDALAGSYTITVGDIPTLNLDTTNVDLSYRVGEEASLSGLTGIITYKDDATKNFAVSLSDLTVSSLADLTATAGAKQITVKYLLEGEIEIIATVNVTVYGISGYDVDTTGVKLSYIVGDALALDGVKIYAKYDDGGERELIDAARVTLSTDGITASAGNKSVQVKVDGTAVASFTVLVEANVVVDFEIKGEYPVSFEKGKDIVFTGLTIELTYKNGDKATVTLDDVTVSGADKNTVGNQTVTLTWTDEKNGTEMHTTLDINVFEKKTVTQFEESDDVADYKSSNATAGNKQYGETGFAAQFENGAIYLIGDDNEFIFYPKFSVMDGTTPSLLKNGFYSTVTLFVKDGDTYTELEARVLDSARPSVVSFYDDETLVATVNTYYGRYQFTDAVKDKEIKISVLPDASRYTVSASINPVTLEAKVVDGYNVFEAWQLCVIDNVQSEWASFKAEKGLDTITTSAIILHKDIKITAADIPVDFLRTLDHDIVYTNSATSETKTVKAGTKYMLDQKSLYRRTADTFTLSGNFFSIDLSEAPLVASPVVFGDEGYGADFSNTSLIIFQHIADWGIDYTNPPATRGDVTVENLSVRGNAGIDKWVDSEGDLVSAGGLLFIKAANFATVTVKNVNTTSCFIPYIGDIDGAFVLDTVKAYDNYQNAIYLWSNSSATVKDSYLINAGGPIIIAQAAYRENMAIIKEPTVNVTDTTVKSALTGQEIWFSAVGATPIVSQKITPALYGIEQMYQGFGIANHSSFIGANGFDIVSVLLSDMGSGIADLQAILGNGYLQGTVLVNEGGMDRHFTDPLWGTIATHPGFAQGAAYLSVGTGADAVVIMATDAGFFDLEGNQIGAVAAKQAEHYAIAQAFANADYFTLSQGGLTVTFAKVN